MDLFLHCQQGSSDKVYSISLRETDGGRWAVLGWNGKWGGTMIPQFKAYRTRREAEADFESRRRNKEQKGYRIVSIGTVWPNGNVLISASVVDDSFVQKVIDNNVPGNAQINWPSGSDSPNFGNPRTTTTKSGARRQAKPTSTGSSNLPAIPAWILTCFAQIPAPVHDRATIILSDAFPAEATLIGEGPQHAEDRGVDWMRAIFARLALDARKNIYRRFSIVLHPDQGGSDDMMARWNETYKRFAA